MKKPMFSSLPIANTNPSLQFLHHMRLLAQSTVLFHAPFFFSLTILLLFSLSYLVAFPYTCFFLWTSLFISYFFLFSNLWSLSIARDPEPRTFFLFLCLAPSSTQCLPSFSLSYDFPVFPPHPQFQVRFRFRLLVHVH
ncbi:uncharacterized protein BP01DRAFT_81084 [Aspergillus saccharolyticus JOP 1030-1]|uniref:Uncharacterized protein n=1 Tax=Aspergillus saccharolyticus JOP 1030-1 TaxID=1450539 RepID=A0A318ZAJ7_9EURO|nr:hypothetical protein BP01DRAFT_81084 [Aspergillus saccharolyticus JOP 1030-1]PYH44366.1 hypothetical protein BP01DRAFT_81084 [Aspergillus saccharolyticus JOP 1030-1]